MLQLDPAIIGKFPNIVVVMQHDVQSYADKGYTLLAICQEDKVDTFQPPTPPYDNNTGRYPPTPPLEHRVLTTALFVLGRPMESLIDDLNAQLAQMSQQNRLLQDAAEKKDKSVAETNGQLSFLRNKLMERDTEITSLRARTEERGHKLLKMEADLAKLRTAFGSKACDEALGVK